MKRIEQLDARVYEIKDEIALLEEPRPVGPSPDDIEDMPNAVLDLRQALDIATPEELAELLEPSTSPRANHVTKEPELSVVLTLTSQKRRDRPRAVAGSRV